MATNNSEEGRGQEDGRKSLKKTIVGNWRSLTHGKEKGLDNEIFLAQEMATNAALLKELGYNS